MQGDVVVFSYFGARNNRWPLGETLHENHDHRVGSGQRVFVVTGAGAKAKGRFYEICYKCSITREDIK